MSEQHRKYFDYDLFRIIPGGKGSLYLVNKDVNSKIDDIIASRDRWKELALACKKVDEARFLRHDPMKEWNRAVERKHNAIATLKEAGEWEE